MTQIKTFKSDYLINFLEKYLPYLKDGSESANLKYVTIDVNLNQ